MFRILALSDFSANAHDALLVAMRIAQLYGGEVIFTHVMAHPFVPATAPQSLFSELQEADREQYREKLRKEVQVLFLETGIRHKEVMYRIEIVPTPLVESALGLSERLSVNLTVMGHSGANVLKRIITGSSTLQMIDRATRPLLIVPPGFVFRGFADITLVIRPKHFQSRAGMDLVFRFARTFRSELNFVFIVNEGENRPELTDFTAKHNLWDEVREYAYNFYTLAGSHELQNLKAHTSRTATGLLVAFPTSKSLWEGLFSDSLTAAMAEQNKTPLLVIPEFTPAGQKELQ